MTGQTEDHVPWICLPQGDLPAVHSRYTDRSSAPPAGFSWGLPSLSLTTEGSWIHLGGGSPNLSSAHWYQYPTETIDHEHNRFTVFLTQSTSSWQAQRIIPSDVQVLLRHQRRTFHLAACSVIYGLNDSFIKYARVSILLCFSHYLLNNPCTVVKSRVALWTPTVIYIHFWEICS